MATTYAKKPKGQLSQHKQATLILMSLSQFMVVLDISVGRTPFIGPPAVRAGG